MLLTVELGRVINLDALLGEHHRYGRHLRATSIHIPTDRSADVTEDYLRVDATKRSGWVWLSAAVMGWAGPGWAGVSRQRAPHLLHDAAADGAQRGRPDGAALGRPRRQARGGGGVGVGERGIRRHRGHHVARRAAEAGRAGGLVHRAAPRRGTAPGADGGDGRLHTTAVLRPVPSPWHQHCGPNPELHGWDLPTIPRTAVLDHMSWGRYLDSLAGGGHQRKLASFYIELAKLQRRCAEVRVARLRHRAPASGADRRAAGCASPSAPSALCRQRWPPPARLAR
jgi:hypothetical protein